jgi:tRNA modification GTPase
VLLVIDASEPITEDDARLLDETATANRIVVLNKIDCERVARPSFDAARIVQVRASALTGEGFDELRQMITAALIGDESLRDASPVTNTRHILLLEGCRTSLVVAHDAAEAENVPEEFLLTDLQAARTRLDEIVGRRTSEDLLRHIFERFCIGK